MAAILHDREGKLPVFQPVWAYNVKTGANELSANDSEFHQAFGGRNDGVFT